MVEPGFAHVLPVEPERRRALQAVMAADIATACRKGKVWTAVEHDTPVAAAIWLAPGMFPVGGWESIRSMRHFIPILRLGRAKLELLNMYNQNGEQYFHTTPCWYLQAFGVAPSHQGKGVGSGLMNAMLDDIGGHDCYLETATPSNVWFYEKFGFEIFQANAHLTPNGGPTHWTLLRTGR